MPANRPEDGVPTGKESVWEYPRPPRVERLTRRARVVVGSEVVADSINAYRVLETSHPPTIYIPSVDLRMDYFSPAPHHSLCEFKGRAVYWDIVVGDCAAPAAAWSYPAPARGFETLKDHFSFYPGRVDTCYLDDEPVRAQDGDFYGGWITNDIVGPFKGPPGTRGW